MPKSVLSGYVGWIKPLRPHLR